ncbi:aminoglycoside phosphotransferase family protein [Paenibacillus catalpae]|uniref:aminoglycoside phosphotransferase family protein n=1 Tax=Paenibacillus catalpae TaxID=1045775 RepID=UPI001FE6877B|nr:phosphotransferase [Paenibacillus catalpae]
MFITISRKQFEELGDDELRRACVKPIAEQIRGKSFAVKSKVLAKLNRQQQALFLYAAWYDHAKQSPMELFCWTAHVLGQRGYWEGVTKAVRFFGDEAMSSILKELQAMLEAHVLQQESTLSEVTFKDLELHDDLREQVEDCYRRFQLEVPGSLHRLARYIRAHTERFIIFLPEGGMDMNDLLSGIPELQDCERLELIHKGYSSDSKYIAYSRDGQPQYLLRTYALEEDTRKRQEFRVLEQLREQAVMCSKPIAVGRLEDYALGYMLLSYIDGGDATDELPLLSLGEQYEIGLQAGAELRKIHQIHAPDDVEPWESRVVAKYRRYREGYEQSGVTIPYEDKLISFIEANLGRMKGRPNILQHDDFHVGNLIVKDKRLSGVIDVNRFDWGDPVHEFLKAGFFSAEVSIPFAVGQIDGYYGDETADDSFWALYSLYIALTILSSVVWILRVRPEELDDMLVRINRVWEDHDGFERLVPKWYSEFRR